MSDQPTITWTLPKLKRFRRACRKADRSNAGVFTFDGHEFVVGYARYLIEYLETRLNPTHERTNEWNHN